ncbi:MAG TPA: cysteine--tRNA ligase [Candidatus Andersenbacteria bacterium]|nr:cysteine--tRNA ligase [Candidatus Andersenbacteria bacterium]
MQQFHLYNSKTRAVEELNPISGTNTVTIYNCGPTVYKRQHIGNMRRFLHADFLKRTLELLGYTVQDITNITDVGHLTQDELDTGEDKMEKVAKALSRTPQDIAKEQTNLFFQDSDTLNIQRSQQYPTASSHITEMISLIEKLLEKKHAYIAKSGVYYDVSSFPEYGTLSGNTIESLDAGHRVDNKSDKKNPADFALWMIDSSHIQLWDSPWGKGYPGWHIECSAMSMKYLGESIDIHTGGEDNRFHHHENEIAQSEGATGKKFVQLWMHNRHLLIDGKKMAKSEGEMITIDTLKERGYSPLAFRLLVFAHHYQTPIDFSWELLDEYQGHVKSIMQLLARSPLPEWGEVNQAFIDFNDALRNDLNTPKAFAIFLQTIKETNRALDNHADTAEIHTLLGSLLGMDKVIGVVKLLAKEATAVQIPKEILALSQKREQAKQEKNYQEADSIRRDMEQKGFTIQDTPTGPSISTRYPLAPPESTV